MTPETKEALGRHAQGSEPLLFDDHPTQGSADVSTIQHGRYDDALTAFDETWYRWDAYRRAVAAGPAPDETTFFALLELEFAADHWRERFVAALARLGMTIDDALGVTE